MTHRLALGVLAVTIAACATAADTSKPNRELDRALAGRTAGPPVDCIDPSFSHGQQIIDDRTLLYKSGRRVWRNDLEAPCPGLRPQAILIVEMHGSQLCRNDLIRATEPGDVIPGPQCRLGKFTPYDKPRT
jgi:hypothetical protein